MNSEITLKDRYGDSIKIEFEAPEGGKFWVSIEDEFIGLELKDAKELINFLSYWMKV